MTAITAKSRFVVLDYEKPETWVNSPAPEIDPRIAENLLRVGGTIPAGYGEFTGQPNFIIVWGQEHKVFLNGRMRLMFDDKNLSANHHINHFAVTEAVYARALEWFQIEEAKRQAAFMNCDWTGFQKFPDYAAYLELHESSLNYFRLPDDADPGAIDRLMPPGYRYLAGLYTYEEIGEQAFYVLQWMGPREFGAESEWNHWRFARAYYPETDNEEFIDVTGEYPHHGQYAHPVLKIADRLGDEIYRYKEPTVENVITPFKELLNIRDRLSDRQKTAEYQTQQKFDNFRHTMEQERPKRLAEFNYIFNQAKPVGKGNPTSLPSAEDRSGKTKDGKGVENEVCKKEKKNLT